MITFDQLKKKLNAPKLTLSDVIAMCNRDHDYKQFSSVGEYGIPHRPRDDGPRAHDLLEGEMAPRDIYKNPHFYGNGNCSKTHRESVAVLRKVRGKPNAMIAVYRGGPSAELNHGDWVSPSREYAEMHVEEGKGKVHKHVVPASHIRWAGDTFEEFGYFPPKKSSNFASMALIQDVRPRVFAGFNVVVENPAGSIRSGKNKKGEAWSVLMRNDYGYIKGRDGADGEGLDVFLGPYVGAENAYIVHQKKLDTGKYDEDKVMLGFPDGPSAKAAYLSNYDRPDFFGSMTEVPIQTLRDAVKNRGGKYSWKKHPQTCLPFAAKDDNFGDDFEEDYEDEPELDYTDIGHPESTQDIDQRNPPKMWSLHKKGEVVVKPVKDEEDAHAYSFPSSEYSSYEGRFCPDTKRVSIRIPMSRRFHGVPDSLKQQLRRKFGKDVTFHEFFSSEANMNFGSINSLDALNQRMNDINFAAEEERRQILNQSMRTANGVNFNCDETMKPRKKNFATSSSRRPRHEIVVGNVGSVYHGDDADEAAKHFHNYYRASVEDAGRAGSEQVTWFRDGEIYKEHDGTQYLNEGGHEYNPSEDFAAQRIKGKRSAKRRFSPRNIARRKVGTPHPQFAADYPMHVKGGEPKDYPMHINYRKAYEDLTGDRGPRQSMPMRSKKKKHPLKQIAEKRAKADVEAEPIKSALARYLKNKPNVKKNFSAGNLVKKILKKK